MMLTTFVTLPSSRAALCRARLVLGLVLTLVFVVLGTQPLRAQDVEAEPGTSCPDPRLYPATSVGDAAADLRRVGQLTGALPLRTLVAQRGATEPDLAVCDQTLEVDEGERVLTILPFRARSVMNSAYPHGGNDGALWAGRGLGVAVSGGVRLRLGPLSAAFAPEHLHQWNRGFEHREVTNPGYSTYNYPMRPHGIDWPQRFGEEPLRSTEWGQSYLRLDGFGLAAGISTENLWWGPAQRYPLLMSNTAPGFPHIFVGTGRPLGIYVGEIELEAIWGQLTESEYFDENPRNDRLLFSGVVVSFSPRGLDGLSIGAARSYLAHYDELSTSDRLLNPFRQVRENPTDRDDPLADNQLVSVFARWAVPQAGLELYGEYAREDHWSDFEHLITTPDMSGAYMLGVQQVVEWRRGHLRLTGELVQLEDPLPIAHGYRGGAVRFYTHSQVQQGYTHRGQLLGAYIGPDANAQYLAADYFVGAEQLGAYVERVRRSGDQHTTQWYRVYGSTGHDLELTAGVRQRRALGPVDLRWGVRYSRRENRVHLGLHESEPRVRVEGNWGLDLEVGWVPWGGGM